MSKQTHNRHSNHHGRRLALATVLGACLGLISVAGQAGVEPAPKPADQANLSAATRFVLECWQQGERVVSETGQGRFAISEQYLKNSISAQVGDANAGYRLQLFPSGESLCVLKRYNK